MKTSIRLESRWHSLSESHQLNIGLLDLKQRKMGLGRNLRRIYMKPVLSKPNFWNQSGDRHV